MKIIISIIAIHIATAFFNAIVMKYKLREKGHNASALACFINLIFNPWRNFWMIIGHLFMPAMVDSALQKIDELVKEEEGE